MDIRRYKIELDHYKISQRCYHIENTLKKCDRTTNFVGMKSSWWDYNYNVNKITPPHAWEELASLYKFLRDVTEIPDCHGSWVNIMYNNSFVKPHIHPLPKKYACTYYPNCSVKHSPIQFFNSTDQKWYPYIVETGDVLVFEKSLPHKIDLQTIDEPRITIAMNF